MILKKLFLLSALLQVELIEELRIKITDTLFEKYIGMSEGSFSRELYMNEEQLKHMLRSGQHIGNHGYNHYWWNSLTKEEMREELDLSIAFLNKIGVDMNNWTACYPYGSYDDRSSKCFKREGVSWPSLREVDIATTNKSTRFVMPRLDTNDIPKRRDEETNEWHSKG